jgi:hypothetical protein
MNLDLTDREISVLVHALNAARREERQMLIKEYSSNVPESAQADYKEMGDLRDKIIQLSTATR